MKYYILLVASLTCMPGYTLSSTIVRSCAGPNCAIYCRNYHTSIQSCLLSVTNDSSVTGGLKKVINDDTISGSADTKGQNDIVKPLSFMCTCKR